jgi:hypothetical protein
MANHPGDQIMKTEQRNLLFAAGGTLLVLLYLCHFFSFGEIIPLTNDCTPGNQPNGRYIFPPVGWFETQFWLGGAIYPQPLTIFSLLLHLPTSIFFTAFYPLCAAMGLFFFYLFLRELGFRHAVGLVGALIYGWQGRMVSNIYGGHFTAASILMLLPLAMWCVLRFTHSRGWLYAVWAGVSCGIMVASMQDQGGLGSLLVGLFSLGYAAFAWRQKTKKCLQIVGCMLLTMFVAALVASPQIESGFALMVTNVKQGSSDDPKEKYAWATQWSWPPEETMTHLVPGYFGWRSGLDTGPYWGRMGRSEGWEQTRQGFRNFNLENPVFGTVPFILMFVGIWSLISCRGNTNNNLPLWSAQQRFLGWVLLGGGIIFFLLGLGKYAPFHQFFYRLPYMGTWRNPVKIFVVPCTFCMIAMASFGLHASAQFLDDKGFLSQRRRLQQLLLGSAVLVVLILLATILTAALHEKALRSELYRPEEIQAIFRTKMHTTFVAGALAVLLWVASRTNMPKLRVASFWFYCFVVIATVGQMFWVYTHYVEPLRYKQAYRLNPFLETLKKSPDPARVKFIAQDGLLHYYLSTVLQHHDIPTIDMPAASRVPEDYAALFQALGQNPFRLWQLGGVKYLAMPATAGRSLLMDPLLRDRIAGIHAFRAMGSRMDDIDMQPVNDLSYATHVLVQLKDYLPKALFVPGLEVLPAETNVTLRLAAPDWNPRQTLLVTREVAEQNRLQPSSVNRQGSARLLRYTPKTIEVETTTESGGYLLINDYYHNAWQVSVNGKETPVFRADLLLRGVALPPGTARVVFQFCIKSTTSYLSFGTVATALLLSMASFISFKTRSSSS